MFAYALHVTADTMARTFDADLTAHATGVIGPNEQGEDYALVFHDDEPELSARLQNLVQLTPHPFDENMFFPCVLLNETSPTMLIPFRDKPSDDDLRDLAGRVRGFMAQKNIGLLDLGFYGKSTEQAYGLLVQF